MKLRDTAEELFDMLGAPFTYWLALAMAYMSWRMLPPLVGLCIVSLTLACLAADEYREVRRG